MSGLYDMRHIELALCEDERTAELGIHLSEHQGKLVVRGDVASEERRDAVIGLIRELAPDAELIDDLQVMTDDFLVPPVKAEEIR